MTLIEIRRYVTAAGKDVFQRWLNTLRDATTRAKIELRIMRLELTTLQTESVDPVGLKRLAQQFITEYYLKNETNADQANFLARAELYQGDFRAADRFMEGLRRVTPDDVRRVARRYLKDFRFAYVGDAAKLDRALLNQF